LGSTIVAVGTTSLRTIESLYWMGVKLIKYKGQRSIGNEQMARVCELDQWEVYELQNDVDPKAALSTLLEYMREKKIETFTANTRIIIVPGYEMKIVKALITNFHQPQSTLLLLIAAVVGENWKKVYDYALENNFRFLSYGDGCLLWAK